MKKTVLLLSIFIFSCTNKQKEIEYFLCKDSIQYWNYEWKRNFPDEFGKTFSFNKNGNLNNYLFLKNSGLRKMYKEDVENLYKWSIHSDSILKIMDHKSNVFNTYVILKYSSDSIKLVDLEYKDTSFLYLEKKKFKILLEDKPKNYLINR